MIMASTRNKVNAFWGPREETAKVCANRLAKMLARLAQIHPVLGGWNKMADRRAEADAPFCAMPPQIDELTQILERSWEGGQSGFTVYAWNGVDGLGGVGFSARVGNSGNWPIFPNSVEINLPRGMPENANPMSADLAQAAILAVAAAWEPDWAGVSSPKYLDKLIAAGPHRPIFRSGWMTYLAAPYARRIIPPPSAITEPVAGDGILMLATDEIFDVGNPQHVAVADAIQACLEPLQSNPRIFP
jgi:hypothetical protein